MQVYMWNEVPYLFNGMAMSFATSKEEAIDLVMKYAEATIGFDQSADGLQELREALEGQEPSIYTQPMAFAEIL